MTRALLPPRRTQMTATAMTMTATAATHGTTRLTLVRKYMRERSKAEPPSPEDEASLPSEGISRAGASVPAKRLRKNRF